MGAMRLPILLLLALPMPAPAVVREFHFVNLLKTWAEAQGYCREKFADLATVESAEDWAKVSQLIESSGSAEAWIGLYDDVHAWRWTTDNTTLVQDNLGSWFVLDADNSASIEHCIYLVSRVHYDGDCHWTIPSLCYDAPTDSYIQVWNHQDWWTAQSYCRRVHTDLATITTQQQFDIVQNMIVENWDWWWLALSRESWSWSDRSPSSYRMWASGEPNGGAETCAVASADGWIDILCGETHPFICSAPQRKLLKVTLRTEGSVNLNDPLVQETALMQVEEALKGQGVQEELHLRWRKPLHGDVFNQTEL